MIMIMMLATNDQLMWVDFSDAFQRKVNRLEACFYKNGTTNTVRRNKNCILRRPLFVLLSL